MRAHSGKCHLFLSSKTPQVVSFGGKTMTFKTTEILSGIIIDSELNHLNSNMKQDE